VIGKAYTTSPFSNFAQNCFHSHFVLVLYWSILTSENFHQVIGEAYTTSPYLTPDHRKEYENAMSMPVQQIRR